MAYIPVDEDNSPGIVGLLRAYPESGYALSALAECLLHKNTPGLSMADREFIAGYVSRLNDCEFCTLSHAGIAERLLDRQGIVDAAVCNLDGSGLSPLLRAFLRIAAKVQADPKQVSEADIAAAREAGAADGEINDAVLIAAAFCMYNRYVEGLGTHLPEDPEFYREGIERTISEGYLREEEGEADEEEQE